MDSYFYIQNYIAYHSTCLGRCSLRIGNEIVIALVRPYKKTYMNVIDALIMENLALLSLMAEKHFSEDNSLLAFCI